MAITDEFKGVTDRETEKAHAIMMAVTGGGPQQLNAFNRREALEQEAQRLKNEKANAQIIAVTGGGPGLLNEFNKTNEVTGLTREETVNTLLGLSTQDHSKLEAAEKTGDAKAKALLVTERKAVKAFTQR